MMAANLQTSNRWYLAVLLALIPAVAGAQSLDEARAHYDRANAFYALGNYAKAAEEFERTFELKSDPALLYNAAQAHRLSGNKARALLLYENYLRVYGAKVSNAEEVKRHVQELKAAITGDEHTKSSPPVTPLPAKVAETPPKPTAAPPEIPRPQASAVTPSAETLTTAGVVAARRPLVKRGWFWGALVGGVVVVGAAVALGVVLGVPQNPNASMGKVNGN